MTTRPSPPTLGAPIDPANPPPTGVVVVPAVADPSVEWGTRQVSAGLALDLDAAILVDAMTRAHLLHARNALATGQRPDGGGEQKPLGRRALANPDRESPHRDYATGTLADGLRRTAIKSDGQTATSRVLPPTSRTAHVAKERARGVELLTAAGAAGEAALAGARAAVAAMASGRKVIHDDDEVDAGGAGGGR